MLKQCCEDHFQTVIFRTNASPCNITLSKLLYNGSHDSCITFMFFLTPTEFKHKNLKRLLNLKVFLVYMRNGWGKKNYEI